MAYVHRFYLGLSSVDAAGVLFYPELFRHAHDAYEAFMSSIGLELSALLGAGRYAVPVVCAHADYRRPLRHGGLVTVRVRVLEVGRSSFRTAYAFADQDGRVCAEAWTIHAHVECAGGRPVPLPGQFRDALGARVEGLESG